MSIKPGAQERAHISTPTLTDDAPAEGSVAVPDTAKAAAKRRREWQEFGRALLYMAPAIVFLIAFTYIPFLR